MQSTRPFLIRSLTYYWRTNLAVILGGAAATAVIAGALLVGDSVRDSLRQMSLDRLAQIDAAWAGRRFVRQSLASSVGAAAGGDVQVAPAISMTAALTRAASEGRESRAGGVSVYGIDAAFWKLIDPVNLPLPEGNSVVLNRRTAQQLAASVDDEVSLVIEIPPTIPRDSLLGDRDQTTTELILRVAAIADDASTPGRFGMNPSQQLPLNAFVSLETLQQQLGLSEVLPTARTPTSRPARVNALFFATGLDSTVSDVIGPEFASNLSRTLDSELTLTDLGLKLNPDEDAGVFALESQQMILEDVVTDAALEAANSLQAEVSPVLVYLLNQMGDQPASEDAPPTYSMYSVAAGIEFSSLAPFGPFEYLAGGPPPETSSGPQTDPVQDAPIPVVISDWLARDLAGEAGEASMVGREFPVRYQVVGDRGELPEDERTFLVTGVAKLTGPAADPGWTPEVEGVTDVERYSDWREPFPLDHDAITERDHEYWDEFRATPKVFLRLADAQGLWRSRYGRLTSLRIAVPGVALADAQTSFSKALLDALGPDDTGLVVLPVKSQGLQAAAGTTDFTGLFIGFSFFLIAAAMLLIGLLFRLGVERRVRELGLLGAVGFGPTRLRNMMLGEGIALAVLGALIGIPASIGYAGLMIYGLKTWWNQAVGTQFLFLSVRPMTLLLGTVGGILAALAAVSWGVWQTRKITTRELLHGATASPETAASAARRGRRSRATALGALSVAAVLWLVSMTVGLPNAEAFGGLSWRVVGFFLLGMLLLVGCLALLATWLASDRGAAVQGRGLSAIARLALRNASRNRGRSLLTTCLIASAAFVIVAVATGKRNPQSETPERTSGNGGFLVVAETSQPLLYDLNTTAGRASLGMVLTPAEQSLVQSLYTAPFRMRPGEDASCLNLYQTQLPTILGVPADVLEKFDAEGRFRFADTPSDHPWLELIAEQSDGRIPVLGDLNTLMFSLKLGIGGTLTVPAAALSDSESSSADLKVTGMLDGSIFQGVLLMSEANFQRLFPNQAGFRYFLIESATSNPANLTALLETQLDDYGFDAEPVAARLANFLAVQNTYLSTFQTLGGLGLLLGTIGLATVMLRNVLERRSELALLRAVGLSPANVLGLVWWENLFLLLAGLSTGAAAALLAMQPHLSSSGADVPWRELALLLGGVLVVGMLAPLAAGREAIRHSIIQSMRSE